MEIIRHLKDNKIITEDNILKQMICDQFAKYTELSDGELSESDEVSHSSNANDVDKSVNHELKGGCPWAWHQLCALVQFVTVSYLLYRFCRCVCYELCHLKQFQQTISQYTGVLMLEQHSCDNVSKSDRNLFN